MSAVIPAGARYLLDFIGSKEAPRDGYNTVYGEKQARLHKPLTGWTVNEIINAKPTFTKRFGSSACGRYQFMRDTLRGLVAMQPEIGGLRFTPALQDQLGWALLIRRNYKKFAAGTLSMTAFGKALAQEWASFPVLAATKGAHRDVKRGDTYYLGDGVNKVLASAAEVERVLREVKRIESGAPSIAIRPEVPQTAPEPIEPAAPTVIAPAGASGDPGGLLSRFCALLNGRPPVPQADRKDVREEVKAEAPTVAKELSGLRTVGLGGLLTAVLGGATDSGLLDSVKGSADQATATFQSVQALINLALGAIKWSVGHWYLFVGAGSIYALFRVGWAIYSAWMQIQQWRAMNAIIETQQRKVE